MLGIREGNRRLASRPPMGESSNVIDPSYSWARSRTIANPSPEPGAPSSARTPRCNTSSRMEGGRPGPSSVVPGRALSKNSRWLDVNASNRFIVGQARKNHVRSVCQFKAVLRNDAAYGLIILSETPELLSQRYVQQSPYLTERVPATIERIKDH